MTDSLKQPADSNDPGQPLMQITLWRTGQIAITGTQQDDLGSVLRTLAEAADAGALTWTNKAP